MNPRPVIRSFDVSHLICRHLQTFRNLKNLFKGEFSQRITRGELADPCAGPSYSVFYEACKPILVVRLRGIHDNTSTSWKPVFEERNNREKALEQRCIQKEIYALRNIHIKSCSHGFYKKALSPRLDKPPGTDIEAATREFLDEKQRQLEERILENDRSAIEEKHISMSATTANAPLSYLGTVDWKASNNHRRPFGTSDRPAYEATILRVSLACFMIYFFVVRNENAADEIVYYPILEERFNIEMPSTRPSAVPNFNTAALRVNSNYKIPTKESA